MMLHMERENWAGRSLFSSKMQGIKVAERNWWHQGREEQRWLFKSRGGRLQATQRSKTKGFPCKKGTDPPTRELTWNKTLHKISRERAESGYSDCIRPHPSAFSLCHSFGLRNANRTQNSQPSEGKKISNIIGTVKESFSLSLPRVTQATSRWRDWPGNYANILYTVLGFSRETEPIRCVCCMCMCVKKERREIDFKELIKGFKELAHMIVGTGKYEIDRVAWKSRNLAKNWCLESKGRLEAEFLSLSSLKPLTDWMKPTYITESNGFTLSLLIQIWITSKKKIFTATSRLVFDPTTRQHSLAPGWHTKLTINTQRYIYTKGAT